MLDVIIIFVFTTYYSIRGFIRIPKVVGCDYWGFLLLGRGVQETGNEILKREERLG